MLENAGTITSKVEMVNIIRLDHDYCSKPYHEQTKREQNFSSIEEDERAIMMKQPMVKNADGKLMVSLLKVCCFPGWLILTLASFIINTESVQRFLQSQQDPTVDLFLLIF